MYVIIVGRDKFVTLDGDRPITVESLNLAKVWEDRTAVLRFYRKYQKRAAKEKWTLYECELKTTLCLAIGDQFLVDWHG